MHCPEYVKNCIDRLHMSGFAAYAVGGAVRDSLLLREPSDWDITTSALPEQIISTFSDRRTVLTGVKHGTVTVLEPDAAGALHPLEITTFRVDGEYKDNRRPESVSFSESLHDDLSRRDFTVNALAYNEEEGIVDEFGGQRDLEARLIRAVGEPRRRFNEDALRILRAFRFSARLGFDIEENTYAAACECAPLLKNIARERVCAEIRGLLCSPNAEHALRLAVLGGVWDELFIPAQRIPSGAELERMSGAPEDSFELRLALLFSDSDGDGWERAVSSLKLSNAEKKLVARLMSIRHFDIDDNERALTARRFLQLYGGVYEPAAAFLSLYFGDERMATLATEIAAQQACRPPLKMSDLAIRGGDILPLCAEDHALVGRVLGSLLDEVVRDPLLNERDTLISLAERIISSYDGGKI